MVQLGTAVSVQVVSVGKCALARLLREGALVADFLSAVSIVLIHEGGYVSKPSDPGGETNFGISKREFPDIDIKNLTVEQAKQIYFDHFWTPYQLSEINHQGTANFIFDLLVNMGPYRDFQIVQRALNEIGNNLIIDGKIGPNTLAAINAADPCQLKQSITNEADKFYRELNKPQFLNGWLARVKDDEMRDG